MRWLALAIVLLWPGSAWSDDLPQGAGHPPGAIHLKLYDQGCCQTNGCEPVPNEAVTEASDGFRILYRSKQFGVVRGFVPRGQERNSNGCYDGMCFHVCAKWRMIFGGSCAEYGCTMRNEPPQVECIYVPSVT
jgi:hypothetical protein